MKKSGDRKKKQLAYAQKNIDFFFDLLKKRFRSDFDKKYIQEIQRISQAFNIRLSRDQKLAFCKECKTYWDTSTREIRFNKELKTKEYVCKECGFVKRIPYKE